MPFVFSSVDLEMTCPLLDRGGLNFSTTSVTALFHGSRTWSADRGERGGVVGYPVGNHELPAMHEAAAGVNDIGHIAVALVYVGFDQWFQAGGR